MAYLELIGSTMGRGDWDLQRSWNFNTTWVHVSFSVSDLNHCTAHLRWFSKDADMFTDEYKGLALSFDLTWRDLNVILSHCCTSGNSSHVGTSTGLCWFPTCSSIHQRLVGMMAVPIQYPNGNHQAGQEETIQRLHGSMPPGRDEEMH